MEVLNNILIKNIRRFGENVDIEVGPGATIFYAPNGTGKTSIFEAIELALTGAVRRLDTNLKSLVRDNCADSSVRLNFDSGKFCQAQFTPGSEPVLTGNHNELFGTTPAENVPFLLRLTHLLNQHAEGWFVQSQSNSAGAQLDYLAIGREAHQANKVITSAVKAANSLSSSVQRELESANDLLEAWLTLLNTRNSSINLDPARPLISYSELFSLINSVAKSFGFNKFTYGNDIQLIKIQHSEIFSVLIKMKEEASKRLVDLETIQPVVEEYSREIQQQVDYKRANTIALTEKSSIDYKIDNLKLNIDGENNKISIAELKVKEGSERLERLQRAFQAEANLYDIATQIDASKTLIEEISKKVGIAKLSHSNAVNIYTEHQALFKREVALAERKSSLIALREAVDNWREYEKNINELENSLRPSLLTTVSSDRESYLALIQRREEYYTSQTDAQKAFDTVNTANDAIRAAIGVIISEIPAQRGDCPVCTQEYAPSELRRRMNEALNTIHPELQNAAARLEEIKNRISKTDKNIAAANTKFIKSSGLLSKVNENIALTKQALNSLINNFFPNVDSVDSAEEQCQQAIADNERSTAVLQVEKSNILKAPSTEELAVLKSVLDKEEVNLKGAHEKLGSLEQHLKKAINQSGDEISTVSLEEFEKASADVNDELKNINNFKLTVSSIRQDIDNQYGILNDINANLNRLKNLLLDSNTNASRYRAQWASLKLQGEPLKDSFENELALLQNNIKSIEDNILVLEQLGNEIARLTSFADYISIEEKISTTKGRLLEVEYTSVLTNNVTALAEKHKLVRSRIDTLNTFSGNLTYQLDRVHELIRSINPLWNNLLKRIVIDPRFSKTELDSYSYYKKPHANVHVPLHGGNTLAAHVASEAQITDLQLTFLLALAQNYQWMPWRALLLDDPTQHHDLVHASAVFDLLRDYAAEKNFQVLLATHDYVQAKFFMRKLQNDGIPARICTLQATANGVFPIYK